MSSAQNSSGDSSFRQTAVPQLPCLKQLVRWLSGQRTRISRDTIQTRFGLYEEDLNGLFDYLQERSLIKDVACIGETQRVQSFVADGAKARKLANEHNHCPGYGERLVPILPRDAVFVVHGRNMDALSAIRAFLDSLRLNSITFRDAIKLTSTPNPHIDDVVAAGMAHSYATLVLFTGDEEARLKPCFKLAEENSAETRLQPQPRLNVIFEAGMALALNPKRTILVQYGHNLRPFSDLAGVFVLPLRDTLEDRRLLKEQLERVGCKVNSKGGRWRTAGNFPSIKKIARGASKPRSAKPVKRRN